MKEATAENFILEVKGIQMTQVPEISEKELLSRVKKGEKAAYEAIVIRYMKSAYYIALGLLRNPQDALDLSQDAFIRAYRKRKSFDPEKPFFPWFYRLLKNLCLDHLKRIKRRDEVPLEEACLGGQGTGDRDLKHAVWKGIEQLSFEHREVIILFYFRQMSYQEIAELLQKPIGTVMSSLYYAKKKLRSSLEGCLGMD